MNRLIAFICTLLALNSVAQEKLEYQVPTAEILELVDVPLAPRVRITQAGEHMILLYRDNYKTIEELSEVEMRLAGLRINPKTNIGSRVTFYNNIKIQIG